MLSESYFFLEKKKKRVKGMAQIKKLSCQQQSFQKENS